MRIKFFIYVLLLLIAGSNCVELYDYSPDEAGSYLVVNGGITQSDQVNRIRLTKSTRYGSNANARPIESAEIFLINSNNESEPFYYEGDGIFAHYGASVKVKVGESYHIEIILGNKKYHSDPQIIPSPIVPDSISYSVGSVTTVNDFGKEISNGIIDIFINTPINLQKNNSFLRWKVDESWMFTEISCHPLVIPKTCYMTEKLELERIFIFSGNEISGNYLPRKLVAQKYIVDKAEFIEKHYFNVHQYSLPKEAYDYWEKVVQLANPSGDIFDLPPAPLNGNIYNINDKNEIVLGYFEVAAKSTVRISLFKNDIRPFQVTSKEYLCGRWSGWYGGACCNCSILKNSSYDRPDYW